VIGAITVPPLSAAALEEIPVEHSTAFVAGRNATLRNDNRGAEHDRSLRVAGTIIWTMLAELPLSTRFESVVPVGMSLVLADAECNRA
jgi:hypothetical protein